MKKYLVPGLSVALVIAIVFGLKSYSDASKLKQNPQAKAQTEANELIAAVGKLLVLPNEEPTVATISDPEKLKDQAFFANAKKGDKVLIYTTAKKAILYDPIENKLIEVAPLVIGNASPTK